MFEDKSMLIEEEIFQKTSIDFDKLESFGFQLKENEYFISKNILNDTFKMKNMFYIV